MLIWGFVYVFIFLLKNSINEYLLRSILNSIPKLKLLKILPILLKNKKIDAKDIDKHYLNAYLYLQKRMSNIPVEMHDTFLKQYSNSL